MCRVNQLFGHEETYPGIEYVSPIAGQFFTIWATKEAQEYWSG